MVEKSASICKNCDKPIILVWIYTDDAARRWVHVDAGIMCGSLGWTVIATPKDED